MNGAGKVTPESVAPSDPTIEAILMMMLIAGKIEKMKTPSACVATTNSTAVRFNGQKPHEKGMCSTPNMT